jgi:hypothetical protein
MATGFPEEWARLGREGLVVEFVGGDGATWVGNFRPGLDGLDDVRWHPNGKQVLICSAGALWCADPASRAAKEIAHAIFNIWELESGDLLLDNQGLAFLRLGRVGVVWQTHRVSWDGFQNMRLDAEQLVGEAWSPIEDRWLPFSVHLHTGRVDGGSYTGPKMHFDYLQGEHNLSTIDFAPHLITFIISKLRL